MVTAVDDLRLEAEPVPVLADHELHLLHVKAHLVQTLEAGIDPITLGGELGYGPWPYVWWWMQNESDPLRRITVTNCWAEANLMNTLKQWRLQAIERGYTRIAELCDYLQADELMHVKIGTKWVRRLTDGDATKREDLAGAVSQIEGFYADEDDAVPQEVHFTFKGGGGGDLVASRSDVIGE